jgi:hypothetical protein
MGRSSAMKNTKMLLSDKDCSKYIHFLLNLDEALFYLSPEVLQQDLKREFNSLVGNTKIEIEDKFVPYLDSVKGANNLQKQLLILKSETLLKVSEYCESSEIFTHIPAYNRKLLHLKSLLTKPEINTKNLKNDLQEATKYLESVKNNLRENAEKERALSPHAFKLGPPNLSQWVNTDREIYKDYILKTKELLAKNEMNKSEINHNLQTLVSSSSLIANDKNTEGLLEYLEIFLNSATPSDKLALLSWLSLNYEALEETKPSQKLFIQHVFARVSSKVNFKKNDSLWVDLPLNEFLKNMKLKNTWEIYEGVSMLKASEASLRITADSNTQADILNEILLREDYWINKLSNPVIKNELDVWVKNLTTNFKSEDSSLSLSYESKYAQRLNKFLEKIGHKAIEIEHKNW